MNLPWRRLVPLLMGAIAIGCAAQTAPPAPMTLQDAVKYALDHYPSVRASVERLNAARANVGLAKTNYLPSANVLWQGNRATHNNTFGLLLPQSVVPSISGPALPTTSNSGTWGSAAGVLGSWEPFDFGYRRAVVDSARANERVAEADTRVTRLDIASIAAAAFFDVAAAQQLVRAAKADVNRRTTVFDTIHVLVKNELKPGADESRANAELARARVRLIQAQVDEQIAKAILADLLGISPEGFEINTSAILEIPPDGLLSAANTNASPVAEIESFRTQSAQTQLQILDRSYFPRFNLQSSLSGRGSGANLDGTNQTGAAGLGLDRANWAAGLTVTFPVMDIFSIRARKQIAEANLRGQEAHYQQVVQDLNSAVTKSRAAAAGARLIALNTPVELRAAAETEQQARARYQAGLTSVVEVSEAQSLLVQAEIDDAVARLNAWRALTGLAAAQGDLQPLLQALRPSGSN